MSPFLLFLQSTKILHDDDCFSWLVENFTRLAETFWKNMCLIAYIPPLPKSHTYWPPCCLWGSTVVLKYCLPGCNPHFTPQIKLNSWLSHCAFFFKVDTHIPINLGVNKIYYIHEMRSTETSIKVVWNFQFCHHFNNTIIYKRSDNFMYMLLIKDLGR